MAMTAARKRVMARAIPEVGREHRVLDGGRYIVSVPKRKRAIDPAALVQGELRRGRSLTFTVHGPPVPKARARKGKGGHWHTPKSTQAYESLVYWTAMRALQGQGWPRDRRYRVECAIYMPNARRADSDNIIKSVLDAGNELLWGDDSQVIEIATIKRIDPAAPRIDVRVYVLETP